MASLSSEEFGRLQEQLLAAKAELYETREREARALKAKDAAVAAMEATRKERAHSQEDGNKTLSNLFDSVKRAAGGISVEKLEHELSTVRRQAASDVDELREQNAALKMNVAHLHKKAQDAEKQNATLMTHLSDLEEERHSLAEKRERELKKRQAKAEGKAVVDDEEDLDRARVNWNATKLQLEAQLAKSQEEATSLNAKLAEKDAAYAKLATQLADEQTNFDRMLSKLSEKDEQLLRAREESQSMNGTIQSLRLAALAASSAAQAANANAPYVPSSSPTAPSTPAPIASPQKSSTASSFRNFLNKITDKEPSAADKASAAAQPPSEDVASALAAAAPSTSPIAVDSAYTPSIAHLNVPASPSSPSSPARPVAWSSSQELEDQVTSLQGELIQLRIMNEHLIASIQKKDSSIQAIQDDCERVMSKLAEKEMQIMSLREGSAGQEDLKRDAKKKDALIAKLQTQLATAAAAPAPISAADAAAATEATAELSSLRETLENTKDMLFLAETQLIDKQKLLSEQVDTLADLRASSEQGEITIANLMRQKEKQETELNEHIDYLERKCLAEVQEWEAKYDEDRANSEKTEETLRDSLRHTQAALETVRTAQRELEQERDAALESTVALTASSEELTRSNAALSSQLAELSANAGIETRKRNTLVHELKSALKDELIRSKETTARLKNAEDDIVTLRVMNQHSIAAQGATGETPAADGQNAADPQHDSSSQSLAPAAPTPSHGKGVEQEVTIALAQKLAAVQNDKHTLMKQKLALEEHLDLLQNDVQQKKEMIRNLVKRVDTDSLNSMAADTVQQQKTAFNDAALSAEAKQALFDKMELILQETTLQNAQYKNHLKSMGVEMTRYMEEAEESRNEAAALRKELGREDPAAKKASDSGLDS